MTNRVFALYNRFLRVSGNAKSRAQENLLLTSCKSLHNDPAAFSRIWGRRFSGCTATLSMTKLYCVYIAPHEEMVREHAKQGGFPANRISQVRMVIDPTTSEA